MVGGFAFLDFERVCFKVWCGEDGFKIFRMCGADFHALEYFWSR